MRIIRALLFASIITGPAAAQTAEETAAAAAGAAFSVIEERLISEFFTSTGLTPQELEVLGQAAEVITGVDIVGDPITLEELDAIEEDADEADGQGQGQGNSKKKKKNKKKKKKNAGGLPPGLAKRDSLPPGLARYVEKHGTLPPGLEVRGLPADLESQLPDPGPGRKRVVVGDDILLIEKGTGRILDILADVIGAATN